MNKNGPIIIIEDDIDDQEILTDVFKSLDYINEVVFFQDGTEALSYLGQTHIKPFLILSDINMPKLNGFKLRDLIFTNEQLQGKCIPYLFFTTTSDKKSVVDAYALSVQGFFRKPNTIEELRSTIKQIVDYWKVCIAPSEYDG